MAGPLVAGLSVIFASGGLDPDHANLPLRERLQHHSNNFTLVLAGILDTAKQNRIGFGRPERLVHPVRQPGPSDFLHASTEP
jgi:hypothetical protein